jgi:hypothetical protein
MPIIGTAFAGFGTSLLFVSTYIFYSVVATVDR